MFSLRTSVLLAAGLLAAACSSPEPTLIDGRTEESFSRTAEQARTDLPVADRLAFDRALASAPTRRFGAADGEALRRLSFDGMTGAEVVADHRARQK
ncbi:MAG: hypothetical protein AVDCRST_MAG62-206 [uncultured Sphingomonas sp.]|uniref:Uncharacterized protein n=1 Tax=uncultured Sphingomonas sp. TaxID=158754 RepID=A0A6J4SUB9_9SPHN|nr:MAG: hypothetical protein AVDCRST_MAG62-206 [uncultured Sphingomonas sp.]